LAFIREVADCIPIGSTQFWNQTLPSEPHFAQPEWARSLPLGDDLAQPLFNQGRSVVRSRSAIFRASRKRGSGMSSVVFIFRIDCCANMGSNILSRQPAATATANVD
jgi:hypothetical protein